MLSDQEAISRMREGSLRLPPLTLEPQVFEATQRSARADASLRISWQDRVWEFDVEYRPYATPRMLRQAIDEARSQAKTGGRLPLILAPYLSEERLRELESAEVSGIDFSGNGLVVVPGELLVFRTGAANQFPFPSTLKNPYRGASSLVPRVLLLQPIYQTVTRVQEEIRRRGGELVLSTVSKVLKILEEEIIVARNGNVRLLQPDKLLDCLAEEFRPPASGQKFLGKLPGGRASVLKALAEESARERIPLAATGAGSAPLYTGMARGETVCVYTSRLRRLLEGLPVEETPRFPDLEVIETEDPTAYFDLRSQDGFPWASPLQTYLELMKGDKRARETAGELRESILTPLRNTGNDVIRSA